jgi:hypothetical protein
MGLAYDDAARQIVFFGGAGGGSVHDDTWTWDGSDWTEQHPTHSPSPRQELGMAYDAAAGNVVLFGGNDVFHFLSDTWTWDGSDWTRQRPALSPPGRSATTTASDANGQVLVFGGQGHGRLGETYFGDTWIWDGTDWMQRPGASMSVFPRSAKPGTSVQVTLWGFASKERVRVYFVDSGGGKTPLGRLKMDRSGGSIATVEIPAGARVGRQRLKARGTTSGQVAWTGFVVT